MYGVIVANALSFYLALLPRLFMWSSEKSFENHYTTAAKDIHSFFLLDPVKLAPKFAALKIFMIFRIYCSYFPDFFGGK